MEKGDSGQVTGTYIQNIDAGGKPFLILYFSKKEAEESGTNLNSVVRGIDKKNILQYCVIIATTSD